MAALTSIQSVKVVAGITGSEMDSLVSVMIQRASAAVENFCQRTLLATTHTEIHNGHGGASMLLREWPVKAVSSVSVDGQAIPAAASFDGAGWRLAGREVVLAGYRFHAGRGNVVIEYEAGYDTVPDDIEHAVIETVQLALKRREHIDVSSKALAGETISYITAELTPSAKQILLSHRRVAPI